MQIIQTNSFKKAVKKLHKNQKQDLDFAIKVIVEDPAIGVTKAGDLSEVSIHKFKMNNQLALLAYSYKDETITLTLLALGAHENFYRDLKRS